MRPFAPILPVFFLFVPIVILNAQITFERNYSHSVYYTQLAEGEEKLFLMDVAFSECRIYNLDHSLYKTIKITLDSNYYLYDISYVTRKLFNNDDGIELLYMAYQYFPGDYPYYQYMVGVADEYGNNLLKVPEGNFYEIIEMAEQKKLLVWLYDNSTWPYFKGTNIYMLESNSTKSITLNSATPYMLPYPNPAAGQIKIPYDLQGKTQKANIRILSTDGKIINTFTVDNTFNELLLDVSEYIPGIYQYTIITEQNEIQDSRKFTITR